MEQKKVQRIIGIVVVIALVIVVIPLLFGKNDFPVQEASNIKAPPFPEQQQSTETSPNTQPPALASTADTQNNPANAVNSSSEPVSADRTSSTAKLPEPSALSAQIEKASPDNKPADAPKMDSIAATNPAQSDKQSAEPPVGSIIYEPASVSTPETSNANPTQMEPVTKNTSDANVPAKEMGSNNAVTPAVSAKVSESLHAAAATADVSAKANEASNAATADVSANENESSLAVATVKPSPIKVKRVHSISPKVIHAKAKSIPVNKFKAPGWVIQMGNFSVRKNAINLTNRLQAAGYKAFAEDVKSPNGKTFTRVYIGPEFKQASAAAISSSVNQKLNLKGFVTSYKNIT